MWKLSGRDNKIRQWAELGEFQSISDAARRVLELERDPQSRTPRILCRLEYQSDNSICSHATCSDFP
jgi:hypothetical protein